MKQKRRFNRLTAKSEKLKASSIKCKMISQRNQKKINSSLLYLRNQWRKRLKNYNKIMKKR